jgi:hypothetical protein
MVRKYFNLEDQITQDSLTSLRELAHPPIVVGGLAIQLHAPEHKQMWRNTPDVDLLGMNNMEYEVFVETVLPALGKYLKKQGYTFQPKRGRNNNSVKVMKRQNKPDEDSLLVHFTTFSPNVWQEFNDYVQRQTDYSKEVQYAPDNKVRAACFEEILPLKIQRSIKFGTDRLDLVGPIYGSLIEHAKKGDWGHLAGMPLREWKAGISQMQEDLGIKDPLSLERTQTYKLSKDIYDLCLAARVISDSLSDFDKERYEDNLHRIINRTGFSSE